MPEVGTFPGHLDRGIDTLKGNHDEVHAIGSTDLFQPLSRLSFVDRSQLWLNPVLLASGKHVFDDGP